MEPENTSEPENLANQPMESEQASEEEKGQYTTTIDGADAVVLGDNTELKIINNYRTGLGYADYQNIAQDVARSEVQANATRITRNAIADVVRQEVAEALRVDRQEALFLNTLPGDNSQPPTEIPLESLKISDWYYGLLLQKQYIVQAVALLHGAKPLEIAQLRDELYLPVKRDREQSEANAQESETRKHSQALYPERLQSSEHAYEHTYAEFRSVYGTERLFWQDTDQRGISTFSLQILLFLAKESTRGSWGQSGQDFLKAAERWTLRSTGDCYWRAARALGIIWRRRDREYLQRLANTWAATQTQRNWRKAASLLEGAYAVECLKEAVDGPPFVQIILNQWIERAHSAANNVSVWVGCAAAYTYGLLGKTFPSMALDGLDHLSDFPANQKSPGMPARLFASIISNYVALTWAGHLQTVLARLALHAEKFTHHKRFFATASSESVLYRTQRQAMLEIVFTVFFMLLVTSSLPDPAQASLEYSLTASAEEIFQTDGLDIVLAGVLTNHASGWRNEVITLCCAVLLDEQKSTLVFECLQQWVWLILKTQNNELRLSLVDFFVTFYKILNTWLQDLSQAGFRSRIARDAFERHLTKWAQARSAISDFAQEVQRSL